MCQRAEADIPNVKHLANITIKKKKMEMENKTLNMKKVKNLLRDILQHFNIQKIWDNFFPPVSREVCFTR